VPNRWGRHSATGVGTGTGGGSDGDGGRRRTKAVAAAEHVPPATKPTSQGGGAAPLLLLLLLPRHNRFAAGVGAAVAGGAVAARAAADVAPAKCRCQACCSAAAMLRDGGHILAFNCLFAMAYVYSFFSSAQAPNFGVRGVCFVIVMHTHKRFKITCKRIHLYKEYLSCL
jgi:hypothetical protein